ncbi:MAG: tetratricopeptide repeat protein, partial [Caldilineaceae bacterium]|nr:tetratricopeptide repeat protein [Caldilineaceae bacterium]
MDYPPDVARLHEYIDTADDESALAFLNQAASDLLTDQAAAELARLAAVENDPQRQQLLQRRLELLQAAQEWHAQLVSLSPHEHLFLAFAAATNDGEMLALVHAAPADELDALEQYAAERAAAEPENAEAIHQRLERLRGLRNRLPDLLAQATQALADRLVAWIKTPDWDASQQHLAEHADELLTEAGEATLQMLLAANEGNEEIGTHITLLARCRELGIDAAYSEFHQARQHAAGLAVAQALADRLIAWIKTPDWDASQQYLHEHAGELLTDAGEATLQLLLAANEGNEQIETHITLLARCRELGIDDAYTEFHQARQHAALRDNPLLRTVVAFLQTEDDAEAQALLDRERNLLLTADARGLIEDFLETARQAQDERNRARFQRRYESWQAAFLRGLGPLRSAQSAGGWSEQAQPTDQSRQPEQTQEADRSARYVVIGNHNMVIGEGATVVTITKVGELPLEWEQPQETQPDLAGSAVGRQRELDDLHQQLQQGQGGAIVGAGAALRGTAGIGKTVLAALYATQYATQYDGGVLWLSLGPGVRSADDVTPELQRIAAYAYRGDAQAKHVLENTVFSAPAVRMLLAGHGPLLVVADDVWSEEVVRTVKAALPAGATLLLTTRDYDVAFALAESAAAIFALDVLSPEDARLLLQSKAPGLPTELANRLAQGLGYHALALTLAAGALTGREQPSVLTSREQHRYARTAEEILARVAKGRGFGDLARMDKADQETRVEEILKFSYDYLGEVEHDPAAGAARQAWFRLLGVFAQEADFETTAAAALWQVDETLAEEYLLLLKGLALIHEPAPERWQQHAILRAYARSLLAAEEQLAGEERHADYYLALARACYRAQPRNDERVELEFKQIERAFAWCRERSPSRAVALANVLDDFMRNRGRAPQLHGWLTAALAAAGNTGDRVGKANTLKSLGDLERRLGNLAQARQHYDDALPLYEAEQDRLGKANT